MGVNAWLRRIKCYKNSVKLYSFINLYYRQELTSLEQTKREIEKEMLRV